MIYVYLEMMREDSKILYPNIWQFLKQRLKSQGVILGIKTALPANGSVRIHKYAGWWIIVRLIST